MLSPSKLPFAQAAKGTWHFRTDDPTNFEARTNEVDHFGLAAEPAEHQDEINAFFFVTYLLEYVDYLHVGGDRGGFGEGSFPDDYPNKTIPLPATVHIPNIYIALDIAAGKTPSPTDPDLAQKVLGLDNAFALNLTSLIEALTGYKISGRRQPDFLRPRLPLQRPRARRHRSLSRRDARHHQPDCRTRRRPGRQRHERRPGRHVGFHDYGQS